MEDAMESVVGREGLDLKIDNNVEEPISSDMDVDGNGIESPRSGAENNSHELEEGSNVVFASEGPLHVDGSGMSKIEGGDCSKHKSKTDNKLSRHERIELSKLFQDAVNSHDWDFADTLISLADLLTLNDFLCISLDSIWFISTQQDLFGASKLIRNSILYGASDFTRAALRTSFLASCVSACYSRTMSLTDTVTVMAQRLHERLQECNGDVVLKAEAGGKVQKFTDWALKCIGLHSRRHGHGDEANHSSGVEIQIQLSAFKTFLDLAGNNLTGKDFTEAFDAACFPLTLFSSSLDPGWSCGTSLIQGLLGMLVEGGADNVNQCFLEASRFGSTELVRILLQIAQRNNLDVDVDLALGFASHYCKIGTMECLVEEGNAIAFLGPLMRAAERGCLPVVQWFVKRGCKDMDLCLALTAATSSSQIQVASYLLPQVPQHVLSALSMEILKAAGERSSGSLDGVAFLLCSNFLGDPAATYAVADSIARSDDKSVAPKLHSFLREHWSEAAYLNGLKQGQNHFVNMVRILKRGESPISLRELPPPLRVAIAYLPLYRECVDAGGCLLPQKLRGETVEAARRLGGGTLDEPGHSRALMAVLEHQLRPFLPELSSTNV